MYSPAQQRAAQHECALTKLMHRFSHHFRIKINESAVESTSRSDASEGGSDRTRDKVRASESVCWTSPAARYTLAGSRIEAFSSPSTKWLNRTLLISAKADYNSFCGVCMLAIQSMLVSALHYGPKLWIASQTKCATLNIYIKILSRYFWKQKLKSMYSYYTYSAPFYSC